MAYNSEPIFYNQILLSYYDKQISTSHLNVEQFVIKDDYGVSVPRLKISIRHQKNNINESISLQYQEIYQILLKLKTFEADVMAIQKDLITKQDTIKNYVFKFKSNFIISLLQRPEYGGLCARVVISKNESYLDSEKFFFGVYDLAAMIKLFADYRSSYCNTTLMIPVYVTLDCVNKSLQTLSDKFESMKRIASSDVQHVKNAEELIHTIEGYDPFSNLPSSSSSVAAAVTNPTDESKLYGEMDQFLSDNKDKIKLDIPEEEIEVAPEKPDVSKATLMDTDFTSKLLHNDILNMEMYLVNLANDDIPFLKWRNIINDKLGINIFDGSHQSYISASDYLLSCYVKRYIKFNIEAKKEFPGIVATMLVPGAKSTPATLSLTYDLMLYFVYYGQLRNMLKEKDFNAHNNKEFITFMLKALSAPFVFSNVSNTTQEIVCSEIITRYRNYKNRGVFKNLETQLYDRYSLNFNLDESVLRSEVTRLYNAFNANSSRLVVDLCFPNFDFVKLSFDDFKNNTFDDEQIKKLIALEFDQTRVLNSDGISADILEKFGISQRKIDNTNLKRYVKEQCKDDLEMENFCIEVVSNINESYQDILGKTYDFAKIPENILKAIYLWDVKKDNKIQTNYIYYCDVISKCSVTKPMLISLITTKLQDESVDFVGSFTAAKDE